MKKYIIFIFIICLNLQAVFSQCSSFDPNWDWTLNSSYKLPGQIAGLYNPFQSTSSSNADLTVINNAQDYQKKQGWVLLFNNLGCPYATVDGYPFFALYNKYRGIIRYFIYNNTTNQGTAVSNLSWMNCANNTNSMLASSMNPYLKPNSLYTSSTGNNDVEMYNINGFYQNAWFVIEYQVTFDKNPLNSSPGSTSEFNFTVIQTTTSNISLSGKFQFTTNSVSGSGIGGTTGKTATSGGNAYTYLNDAKQFMGKAPSTADVQKYLTQIGGGLNTVENVFGDCASYKIADAAASFSKGGSIYKFLTDASGFASAFTGGLGIVASVVDMFIGKSSSSSFTPTVSTGTISLSGTMTTSTPVASGDLQIPGSNHYYSDGITVNIDGMPTYDCPLGTVTLENSPVVNYRTFSKLGIIDITGAKFNYNYISYKINDNIQMAINYQSGLNIINAYAQLIAEVANNPKTPIYITLGTGNQVPYLTCPDSTWYCTNHADMNYYEIHYNFLRDALNSGMFQLNGFRNYPFKVGDGLGTNDHANFQRMLISTPFVPIDNFKNTSITVPVFSDSISATVPYKVYVKIMLTLMPTDPAAEQTPVLHVVTYDVSDKLVLDADTIGYNPTADQLVNQTGTMPYFTKTFTTHITKRDGTSTYITSNIPGPLLYPSNDSVVLNLNKPVLLVGNVVNTARDKIILKPGTTIQPIKSLPISSYKASINPGLIGTSSTVTPNIYNMNCNCTAVPLIAMQQQLDHLKSGKEVLNISDQVSENLEVYPSPTDGRFTVNINSSETYDVSVYDISGKLVNDTKNCLSKQDMDISAFPSGVYIVKVISRSTIFTKKIVKK